MMTPIDEKKDDKIRSGMVQVSDGKSRPMPARLVLTMEAVTVQREVIVPPQPPRDSRVPHARERMVQITRQKVGGLGLSIKGGAEHKLPILISKIYKEQAADQTGQLFVGDAVIKVNGEYITACKHDDAVNILRNAGDIVVLTVKHYRAATPFLQKQGDGASDTDSSTGDEHPSPHSRRGRLDDNCNSDKTDADGGWQSAWGSPQEAPSRPESGASDRPAEGAREWVDVVSVPLMMAYVTRYVLGTDKLRPGAFEVRGARPHATTGVVHVEDPAALSLWLKGIADNIAGLTNLQMKLLNRHLAGGEHISYLGWVQEAELGGAPWHTWHTYRPRFLVLKGTDVMLFDTPPMSVAELAQCPDTLKVYQTLFRAVRESETVDWRPHCFLLQSSAPGPAPRAPRAPGPGPGPGPAPGPHAGPHAGPRYFSADTRRELLRLEAAWTANVVHSVVRLGKKTFTVVHQGRAAGLTLDWAGGFSLAEGGPGAAPLWAYRFSQLRGSSDDGKSKLKLHFQDSETKLIETKELECQILQSLLFCMHAFLTAKVASVDPAFLAAVHRAS